SKYIRGNLAISVICTFIIWLGLFLIGIPYALPLAILTATLDLLPMVGPMIGAVPALILGFSISPIRGVIVLALYLAYQETENALISPLIYNKALNISASLSFLSVVIGGA